LISQLRSTILLRLDAAKLAEPSYSDNAKPRVEYDGAGMASVLALMALNQPETFESLQENLKTLIPSLKRIRFDRVPVNRIETEVVTIDGASLTRRLNKEYMGDEVVLDFQGASDIPANLASEGTILVLGLLTALLGSVRPKLVLLDDLDHGLHPKAQRKVIPLIRRVLEENPDLQIIATTHSPYVVDELDPKEVRITWANEEGVTQCARLENHPDFERWKDELWPGEFWSLVGEQWVGNGQGREGQ
jgi:AAA domain, putative AbiEii toxin, Type IV TA system